MSAEVASPIARGRSPLDPVRALQHALYRSAKADPGRRFHALMDKVWRTDVLWRAWVTVRRNDGAPGIDKATLLDVEEYGRDWLLGELATELREGDYRPLPARRVFIDKPGLPGEQRPLSIPSVRDRIVQAALKIVLEPVFEAIPHSELIKAVEERACDQSVLKLLRVMLRAGVMENGSVRKASTGTPQGRGDFAVALQRVPAPDRSGLGCA